MKNDKSRSSDDRSRMHTREKEDKWRDIRKERQEKERQRRLKVRFYKFFINFFIDLFIELNQILIKLYFLFINS